MNLQQLYYFKTIAEMEHYTKAAEKLLISQPSLSYAMSDLERELGAPLFVKRGRNVTLTKFGRVFLEYATRSLTELENGKRQVAQMLDPNSGTVIISYASSMGVSFIPYIVSAFYEQEGNSGIKFTFEQRPTPETVALFKNGNIDLGFGSKISSPDMVFHPIYREKMMVVVPPSHPLAGRKSVDLREIAGEKLVTWNKNCASRGEIEALYKKVGVTPEIAYEVQDETMITGIVSRGMGIGIVPKLIGTSYQNVRMLEIENFKSHRTMYMIWPQNCYFSPAADKFRQFVMEHMQIEEE